MASRRRKAEANAIAGAATAGIAMLCARPCHWTPFEPDWTSAAPTRPPISAWEELDGSPRHQVTRFQAIAPTSAASTVSSFARPVSMIPLPTVFATAVVTKAPARLATAATKTAIRGESARVETEVATAFAVSWKPFVKSKPSATTTTTQTKMVSIRSPDRSDGRYQCGRKGKCPAFSAVLDEDRLEDVRGVLERIAGIFQPLVDVLPADDHDRVLDRVEELRHSVSNQPVALILEAAQLDELGA